MPLLDSDFVSELAKGEPLEGLLKICNKFMKWREAAPTPEEEGPVTIERHYEYAAETYACLKAFAESHGIEPRVIREFTGDRDNDLKKMLTVISSVQKEVLAKTRQRKIGDLEKQYKVAFGSAFYYEFSRGDLERVQNLVNQLRDLITKCNDLKDEHKQRLLKRLEKLQSELHKRVSDLDRYWGIILECGAVMQRLGENAKPAVDVVREIAEIVWGAQNRGLELPSNLPLKLPGDKTKNNNHSDEQANP